MANRLTLDIVNVLAFRNVLDMEETHPAVMGIIGGIVLDALDKSGLTRYETTIESDAAAWSSAIGKLKECRAQYNYHYGGFGNDVYVKKGAQISIDETEAEHERDRHLAHVA